MTIPVIQAPMAGVSNPELAAIVSNEGALGSIALGASSVGAARGMIESLRKKTSRAFNVNLFVHAEPVRDQARERAWLEALQPLFRRYHAQPPPSLDVIYTSFALDDDMMRMLLEAPPPVVSFHFGLPQRDRIAALRQAGCVLLSCATNLEEARSAQTAGIDAVVAQGYEAGGHRGVFDPDREDDCLATLPLTRLLASKLAIPVIAAGGVMDGRGVRAALDLGAVAAQMGTAFIACPESSADDAYRAALGSLAAQHTVMTRAISGRPARCLANAFTRWGEGANPAPPAYPLAYDAGKALNAAARSAGETGFGAQWAGQGAPLSRPLRAADLLARIREEMSELRPLHADGDMPGVSRSE
jgi:nitronate monooxygenase